MIIKDNYTVCVLVWKRLYMSLISLSQGEPLQLQVTSFIALATGEFGIAPFLQPDYQLLCQTL